MNLGTSFRTILLFTSSVLTVLGSGLDPTRSGRLKRGEVAC